MRLEKKLVVRVNSNMEEMLLRRERLNPLN